MVKRRRRFKQTTTLAHRLTEEAGRLRERARQVPPGSEQISLWRKVRQTEAALRIDAWLSSPHSVNPNGLNWSTNESHESKQDDPARNGVSR